MVASVYGKCDGQTIIFSKNEKTGRWETAVPFNQDGEYVVELTAVDDCGNESYYATLLFAVDTTKLCVKVQILKLSAQAKKDGAFRENIKTNKWKAKVVRCELCGRF